VGQADAVEERSISVLRGSPLMPWSEACRRRCCATRQERVERRLLQRSPDRRAHLRAVANDIETATVARPTWWEQRGQHVHRRRLAGAVRAEKAVDLTGLDVQIDPVDRPNVLELAYEGLDLDSASDVAWFRVPLFAWLI